MRLLVLGGSWFYGRAVAEAAIADGWEVTTFHRGVSGQDADGVRMVTGDRSSDDDLARLAATGPWDVVVDASGYVPANVLSVARALEPRCGRYVFASTVSVYRDWPDQPVSEASVVKECEPGQRAEGGAIGDPGPALYGAYKAGCERAAQSVFGEDRAVVLRSHVMLGPREYVGRTAWWLRRMRRGGRVLAPGSPDRPIQPIDVRDAAAFTLTSAVGDAGVFDIAGSGADTMRDYLLACRSAVGSDVELSWVGDDILIGQKVGQWVELPLWRPQSGTWAMSTERARVAGLTTRPIAETVADTAAWLATHEADLDHARAGGLGLSADREQAVLTAWDAARG